MQAMRYRRRPNERPPEGGRKLGRKRGALLGLNPKLGDDFDPEPKVRPAPPSPRLNPPVAYFELP